MPLPASDLAVGIDVGVTTFATFSDGTEIQNPRIYQNAQAAAENSCPNREPAFRLPAQAFDRLGS